MTRVVWEDPPRTATTASRTDWPPIADALKKKPGEWAVVKSYRTSNPARATAQKIRNGHLVSFGQGDFEAVSRLVGTEYRVYARYVGS